jgi:hypothetical protein
MQMCLVQSMLLQPMRLKAVDLVVHQHTSCSSQKLTSRAQPAGCGLKATLTTSQQIVPSHHPVTHMLCIFGRSPQAFLRWQRASFCGVWPEHHTPTMCVG